MSGFRRADGVIVASLVRRADGEVSRLAGPVERMEGDLVEIAGTKVRIENAAQIALGDEVRVTGRWEGSRLAAATFETIPRVPFDGRVARVEVEGYARATAGKVQIGSFVFELPESGRSEGVPPDARVRVEALVQDRRAIIERIGAPPGPPRPGAMERDGARGNGWSGGALGDRPAGEQPERPDSRSVPPRPAGGRGIEVPPRPDRPDRPPAAGLPERPPRIDRPPLPERAPIPDLPPGPCGPISAGGRRVLRPKTPLTRARPRRR